jgi:hypothetical protein
LYDKKGNYLEAWMIGILFHENQIAELEFIIRNVLEEIKEDLLDEDLSQTLNEALMVKYKRIMELYERIAEKEKVIQMKLNFAVILRGNDSMN